MELVLPCVSYFEGDNLNYSIGVDIGGTKIKIIILKNESIFEKYEIKTNLDNNGEYILKDVAISIIEYLKEKNIETKKIFSIGVGVPGPVVDNKVLFCVNLFWKEKDVIRELSDLLPFKTYITCLNDANATIYSEVINNYNSAVMLTIGTGIGGSIFINDIIEGVNGSAGEYGHMFVDSLYNFKCNCGLTGCLETVASATGVSNIYKYKTGKILSCKEIFELAATDDIASEVVEEITKYLGVACANIAIATNPEVIIIGGGVSNAKDMLLTKVEKYFRKYSFKSVSNTKIILASLGNDAGGIGGALYAKKNRESISYPET